MAILAILPSSVQELQACQVKQLAKPLKQTDMEEDEVEDAKEERAKAKPMP